uniref:Uncharacterized protein n=1 Tax=viral metagenome TaxID=1070528 RepID=A0A6C0BM82_9ZZZZ
MGGKKQCCSGSGACDFKCCVGRPIICKCPCKCYNDVPTLAGSGCGCHKCRKAQRFTRLWQTGVCDKRCRPLGARNPASFAPK